MSKKLTQKTRSKKAVRKARSKNAVRKTRSKKAVRKARSKNAVRKTRSKKAVRKARSKNAVRKVRSKLYSATFNKIISDKKSIIDSDLKIDILYTQTYQIAEYLDYYLKKTINVDIRIIKIRHLLRKLASLPWKISRLLFLEYPGAIIIDRESQDPIAVIEIFGRKPMGYNHSQFYARLVQSAKCGVPFLIIFPSVAFQKRRSKGGRNAKEYDSPIYLEGIINANKIFNTPVLSFNWEMGDDNLHGNLKIDTNFSSMPLFEDDQIQSFFKFLSKLIDNFNKSKEIPLEDYKNILSSMENLKTFLETRQSRKSTFEFELVDKKNIERYLRQNYNFNGRIPPYIKNEHAIVHKNGSKTFRSDPYVGLYALYHISNCISPDYAQKYNLLVVWNKITFNTFKKDFSKTFRRVVKGYYDLSMKELFYSNNKLFKCLYYFTNGIILNNGILFKSIKNLPPDMDQSVWEEISEDFPIKVDLGSLKSYFIDEEDVAYEIKYLLENLNWKILSFNPPRGIRHIGILDEFSGEKRAKDSVVPDLIAIKGDNILVLEFKAEFNRSDVEKLSKLSEKDLTDIAYYFNLSNHLKLLTGVGFVDYRVGFEYVEELAQNMVIFIYNEINIKMLTSLKENLDVLKR